MITFSDFLHAAVSNPYMLISVVLTVGVVIANGWAAAPNAVASSVATHSVSPAKAILVAGVFNAMGLIAMTFINSSVALTIYRMVDFRGNQRHSLVALYAAMAAILIWTFAAWKIGIPTSQGHALIAAVSGAAVALQGGLSGIYWSEWVKVLYGLVLSVVLSVVLGFSLSLFTEMLFTNAVRRKTTPLFKKAQIGGAAALSFMNGAQDGQKLMGLFLLGLFLAKGNYGTDNVRIPLWIMVTCAFFTTAGTFIGGARIIRTVGLKMVKIEPYQGVAADLAASASLMIASLLGLPASLNQTKTMAVIGGGASRKLSAVNWGLVKGIVLTWIFTFPGCGLLGYMLAWLLIKLFG